MITLNTLQRATIKRTTSLCPVCRQQLDAEVYERGGRVFLAKTCPEHGDFDVLINSDRRYYYDSVGASSCCGGTGCCTPAPSGEGHDPTRIEAASTCIALIEIVTSCNLKCPTCYADSPWKDDVEALSFEEVTSRIDAVIARKGKLDILQLSGGEPTLHPRFFDVLGWALRHEQIGYVLLNTNGVLLAADDDFMARLTALHDAHKGFEVYLQYDGPQEASQRELRGSDLRAMRKRVIERCEAGRIPVTLAMTVTQANLGHIGDTLRAALEQTGVRGITFQPAFTSGRTPGTVTLTTGASSGGFAKPQAAGLNVADVIGALIGQSAGLVTEKDLTPLPCGDPNCHTVGYLLRGKGPGEAPVGVSQFIDFATMQGFLKDRVNYDLEDLIQCGCESQELGHVLKQLEIGPDRVLRLFIKPFMDAWTYDQHRVDRCCVHVVGEGGALESFCRHYAMR